jgi:AraC-like DNA-binding protein
MKVISKTWLMETLQRYYYVGYDIPFLFGPLLLLFAKSKTNIQPRRSDVLSFIPFLIGSTISLLRQTIQDNITVHYYLILFLALGIFQLALLVSCAVRARRYLLKTESSLMSIYSNVEKTQYLWSNKLIIAVGILGGFLILYLRIAYLMVSFMTLPFIYIPFFLALIGISFYAMQEPEVTEIDSRLMESSKQKYANSKLADAEVEALIKVLEDLMRNDKVFLDPELSIDKLADRVGTSKHKLSQILNSRLQQSYFDYINYWRVEEAKTLLLSPKMHSQRN